MMVFPKKSLNIIFGILFLPPGLFVESAHAAIAATGAAAASPPVVLPVRFSFGRVNGKEVSATYNIEIEMEPYCWFEPFSNIYSLPGGLPLPIPIGGLPFLSVVSHGGGELARKIDELNGTRYDESRLFEVIESAVRDRFTDFIGDIKVPVQHLYLHDFLFSFGSGQQQQESGSRPVLHSWTPFLALIKGSHSAQIIRQVFSSFSRIPNIIGTTPIPVLEINVHYEIKYAFKSMYGETRMGENTSIPVAGASSLQLDWASLIPSEETFPRDRGTLPIRLGQDRTYKTVDLFLAPSGENCDGKYASWGLTVRIDNNNMGERLRTGVSFNLYKVYGGPAPGLGLVQTIENTRLFFDSDMTMPVPTQKIDSSVNKSFWYRDNDGSSKPLRFDLHDYKKGRGYGSTESPIIEPKKHAFVDLCSIREGEKDPFRRGAPPTWIIETVVENIVCTYSPELLRQLYGY